MANIFPRILKNVRFQLFLNKRILIIYNDFEKKGENKYYRNFSLPIQLRGPALNGIKLY